MNRSLTLLFLAVSLLGCPKRLEFGPEGPITEPAVLLSKVRAAEESVWSLEGEAKLRVDSPEGRGPVQLFLAVQRPGSVHVEAMDFFGKPQGILVSDGRTFGFYDARENRYYRGPASGENLARFLPLVLPPVELVGLLLGAPPTLPPERSALEVDEEKKAYRLMLERSPIVQTVWVDPELFRVRRSEIRGVDAYDVAYDSWQRFGGEARVPFEIRLVAPAAQATLELRYTSVKVNERVDPGMFEVSPPEDVPVVEVNERGQPRPAP